MTRSIRQARSMRRQHFRSTGWNSLRPTTSLSSTGRPLGAPGCTQSRLKALRSREFDMLLSLSTQAVARRCERPEFGQELLRALIAHLGRAPRIRNRLGRIDAHAMIVRRARAYVLEHLAEPISPDALAKAALTSRRTLFRAFAEILGDTPQFYVRRLRLHRIRQDLASDEERACTVALIANQWGIGEFGRMSRRYRELFGELPSDTLANQRRRTWSEGGRT